MIENFIKDKNMEYTKNTSLKRYNTYRVDTTCDFLVFPNSEQELIQLLKFLKDNNQKYIVLGNGSNTIFSMEHFDGVVIKLDKFNKFIIEDNYVTVGAGNMLSTISIRCSNNNLAGMTFSAGIPGQIGASIAMNAGAYKEDMSFIVDKVKVITPDLQIITMKNKDLDFEYRSSFLKKNKDYIVIEAVLKLSYGDKDELIEKINKRRKKRLETQPLEYPSAGSVFRNPKDMFAGELIENCHLKGKNINGAEVSVKHANFIINRDNATGKDIIDLINFVKKEVKDKYNVDLIMEQIIL